MLIDYRTLVDFIVPAVVVGVFMGGKIAASTIGSILAGRSPGDSLRVGMTMPQMGEFSLAIGRLSPSDALGVSPLGAIFSIATAATSVLAPLTARASQPLSRWIGRRSPAILHRVMLAVRLGVDTFWSAFSLEGEIGIQLRNAGRSILINICIVVVIGAAGTAALFATPALVGDALEVSKSLVGLIMVGIVMGLSTPSVIAIWRSLERLSHLSTIFPDAEEDNGSGLTLRLTLRAMVKNGLAAVFLILLFLLSLPLINRMLSLGSLTTLLSVILLVAPMVAVGIFSFKVHRVLEPAFNETFLEDPDAEARNVEEHYIIAAATDSIQDEGDPLVVNVIDRLNEQGELIQLLEGKVARQQGRTIAKSGCMSEETCDSLFRAEGTGLGSQRHGHSGRKPSFQTQGVQTDIHQSGKDLTQPRTAQRVPVFIPTAVFHVMQVVLNAPMAAPMAAEQPEHLTGAAPVGRQAGQQIPTLFGCFTSGYRHSHLFHHCRLLRPGKPQFLPDIASYSGVGPEPPYLDAVRFFSMVSACGSPSSSSGNPSDMAASKVDRFPLTRTR